MSDTRHLCTECWTEGKGSAPKACLVCGMVGAWFVTATHGDRPLKEVLVSLFSGYRVPPELEDVLEKPSERAKRLEGEKQAAELREAVNTILDANDPDYEYRIGLRLAAKRLSHDPGLPEGVEIEVLATVPMLWSGWECDSGACLYRILPDGEPTLHVFDAVNVTVDGLEAALRERLAAYERLAQRTRDFLVYMGADYPPEALEVLRGMEPARKRPEGHIVSGEEMQDMEEATKAVKETRAARRKRAWREDDG